VGFWDWIHRVAYSTSDSFFGGQACVPTASLHRRIVAASAVVGVFTNNPKRGGDTGIPTFHFHTCPRPYTIIILNHDHHENPRSTRPAKAFTAVVDIITGNTKQTHTAKKQSQLFFMFQRNILWVENIG